MNRITPAQKRIADAHIAAYTANKYDDPALDGSKEQLKTVLVAGKTIRYFMETVVSRLPITTQLLAKPELFGHQSRAFKTGVYREFKTALNNLNIQ